MPAKFVERASDLAQDPAEESDRTISHSGVARVLRIVFRIARLDLALYACDIAPNVSPQDAVDKDIMNEFLDPLHGPREKGVGVFSARFYNTSCVSVPR